MAITLPLPVRVAAGLVATGIQLVRSLPEEIPAIPVTLVGNAMKLSMKVQQEITTLATRGDELLGGFIGGKPEETATWATFDEDKQPTAVKPAPARPATRPSPAGGESVSRPARPWDRPKPAEPVPPPAEVEPEAPTSATVDKAAEDRAATLHTPETTSLSDTETTATEAAAEVSDAVIDAATLAAPDAAGEETPDPSDEPDPATSDPGLDDGPAALPGYDRMTLAQVRGHLRELSAEEVSTLLAYEQSSDNRAPFLTLLSNRLVTLGAQDS